MNPKIPLFAIAVYSILLALIYFGVIPNPLTFVESIKDLNPSVIFLIMFLVILFESIAFLGFYLPGQFIAVLLVVTYARGFIDILGLTTISILAVTFGAFINYYLGLCLFPNNNEKVTKVSYKKLFLSMIHITTIALFVFDQGSKRGPKKIIYLTGLLNFPYYLVIIGVTYYFKNQVMAVSENPYIIFVLLFLWLGYSLFTSKNLKHA